MLSGSNLIIYGPIVHKLYKLGNKETGKKKKILEEIFVVFHKVCSSNSHWQLPSSQKWFLQMLAPKRLQCGLNPLTVNTSIFVGLYNIIFSLKKFSFIFFLQEYIF